MASIINSISFKNFFNYYGDYFETRYDFEEGVNIIVADNGAGKSKFFNAFLWLFYDQILDSDDKIKKGIKDIAVKIISDKAKKETPIGGSIETGIQIEYSNGRFKYQITKSFTATRISESITSFDSWQITINDIEVNRTDHVLPRYTPVYDADEKLNIIKQLIRPDLRQYSFFQGEEVDSIIDFGKKSPETIIDNGVVENWIVGLNNTGAETNTGGRIFKLRDKLTETFLCTYGDGVANVNISDLVRFHRRHGKIATVTAVHPSARFGSIEITDDGQVTSFAEKPVSNQWVNGGFFVFEPQIFGYLSSDSVLERGPLERLAQDSHLMAWQHDGFWHPMDTIRDAQHLNELWDKGNAPWKVW